VEADYDKPAHHRVSAIPSAASTRAALLEPALADRDEIIWMVKYTRGRKSESKIESVVSK
jgi:hypothetical protein